MDINCPKRNCGEPVEIDYFHDVADEQETDFSTVYRNFQSRGCEAIGLSHSVREDDDHLSEMAAMSDAMMDLLGDDVDGVAAMLEDFEMGY